MNKLLKIFGLFLGLGVVFSIVSIGTPYWSTTSFEIFSSTENNKKIDDGIFQMCQCEYWPFKNETSKTESNN